MLSDPSEARVKNLDHKTKLSPSYHWPVPEWDYIFRMNMPSGDLAIDIRTLVLHPPLTQAQMPHKWGEGAGVGYGYHVLHPLRNAYPTIKSLPKIERRLKETKNSALVEWTLW